MSKLTPQAQELLALARKEAMRLKHRHVTTGHLLLGLTLLQDGEIPGLIDKLGIDRNLVRERLAAREPEGSQPIEGRLPCVPAIKRTLVLAGRESRSLGHSYIGAEHILLALLNADCNADGEAVLRELQIDPDRARSEVRLTWVSPEFRTLVEPQIQVQMIVATEYRLMLFDTSAQHKPIARLISPTPFHAVRVGERFDDTGWTRLDGKEVATAGKSRRYTVHSIKHLLWEIEGRTIDCLCLNLTPWEGESSPVWGDEV